MGTPSPLPRPPPAFQQVFLPDDFFESFIINYTYVKASLVVHMVKNLPAMQETRVQSLGQEDPLEEGMATHSRIFAWRSPWPEEPGGL